jgi:hypothetical protein
MPIALTEGNLRLVVMGPRLGMSLRIIGLLRIRGSSEDRLLPAQIGAIPALDKDTD